MVTLFCLTLDRVDTVKSDRDRLLHLSKTTPKSTRFDRLNFGQCDRFRPWIHQKTRTYGQFELV